VTRLVSRLVSRFVSRFVSRSIAGVTSERKRYFDRRSFTRRARHVYGLSASIADPVNESEAKPCPSLLLL